MDEPDALDLCSCGLACYLVNDTLQCLDHCDGPRACIKNADTCAQCRQLHRQTKV
jgi:hypothetical protein